MKRHNRRSQHAEASSCRGHTGFLSAPLAAGQRFTKKNSARQSELESRSGRTDRSVQELMLHCISLRCFCLMEQKLIRQQTSPRPPQPEQTRCPRRGRLSTGRCAGGEAAWLPVKVRSVGSVCVCVYSFWSLYSHWLLKLVGAFPARIKESSKNLSVLATRTLLLSPPGPESDGHRQSGSACTPAQSDPASWTHWQCEDSLPIPTQRLNVSMQTFTSVRLRLLFVFSSHLRDIFLLQTPASQHLNWISVILGFLFVSHPPPYFFFLSFSFFFSMVQCHLYKEVCRVWCARLPDRTMPALDFPWKVGVSRLHSSLPGRQTRAGFYEEAEHLQAQIKKWNKRNVYERRPGGALIRQTDLAWLYRQSRPFFWGRN